MYGVAREGKNSGNELERQSESRTLGGPHVTSGAGCLPASEISRSKGSKGLEASFKHRLYYSSFV